jgi:hypothetical protein
MAPMSDIIIHGIADNMEQESLFPTEQMFVTWLEGLQKACNLALEAKTWNVHTDSRKQLHPAFVLSGEGIKGGEGIIEDDHVLGRYFPNSDQNLIEIYLYNCIECAKRLGINVSDLIKKVCIHELSHLVMHQGARDVDGTIYLWQRQKFGRRDLEEHFAQMATYVFLLTSKNHETLKAMQQLSERQPVIYRTWEIWDVVRIYSSSSETLRGRIPMNSVDGDKWIEEFTGQISWMLSRLPERDDMGDTGTEI